jgi:hypothetical protein
VPFLLYAKKHKIVVQGYPPNSTQALQGLDVAPFAEMKRLWTIARNDIEQNKDGTFSKASFLKVYAEVRKKAFTRKIIKAAFKKTGIRPFDPSVITPEQMAPAEALSSTSGAPLAMPTPTGKKVLQAVHDRNITSTPLTRDIEQKAHTVIANLEEEGCTALLRTNYTGFSSATPIPALLLTPSANRVPSSPNNHPPVPRVQAAVDRGSSPSSRVATLRNRVSQLEKRVAELEHSKDIYRSQVCALHVYCEGAQSKLYHKENRDKTRRQILEDKGERCMTDDAWLQAELEDLSEKEYIAWLKQEKADWKRKEKDERDEAYAQEVAKWREERDECRRRKAKPPLKPKPPQRAATPEMFNELKMQKKKRTSSPSDDESNGNSSEGDP